MIELNWALLFNDFTKSEEIITYYTVYYNENLTIKMFF